jgi:hypothetical protein
MADDPWADFRAPVSPASTPDDPWAAFRAPAEKPSVTADIVKSIPAGVEGGVAGLVGLPGDLQEMSGSMIDRAMLGVGHKIMDWTGYGPQAGTPEREQFDRMYLGIGSGGGLPTSGDIKKGVEAVAGPVYEPQTGPGKLAKTALEFAPAAILGPGGAVRKIAETVVPAMASEGAGALTAGTKAEPAARVLGALAGGASTSAVAARQGAVGRMVADAAPNLTQAQVDAANALVARARDLGVPLSGAEALQHVTQNGTKLGDLQRFAEGSTGQGRGGAALSEFYAQRPQQMRDATNATLNQIAPQSATPSRLGPQVAGAAEHELDAVRQGINRATSGDYQASGAHIIDPADFAPIARDPAFQASLRRLREDEVLGPTFANQPDNSVAVIDAVTKDMRDRGVALGNRMNPGFSSQTAGLYGSGAAEARAIARDPARGGSQAYDDALTAQAQARQQNLEPLEQGPLGRLAEATDTRTAGQVVLPQQPLIGGAGELADTVGRVSARAPDETAALVRQRIADQYDKSAGRLVGGPAQGGGARFAKDIAGTTAQEEALNAVVGALNRPGVQEGVATLLDVLRATGTRRAEGSVTNSNQQIRDTANQMPLIGEAANALRTAGASLFTSARDNARRAYLGRRTSDLADLLTRPDSVDALAQAARASRQTPMSDAVLRSLIQGRGTQ